MTKSANELMQEAITAAVVDAIVALKAASGGVPNNLLRAIGAIHANTAAADLPDELQASIRASVREAFTRLLREGYSVSTAQPPARPEARPTPLHHQHRRGAPGPRGDRPPRKGPGGGQPNKGPGNPGGRPQDGRKSGPGGGKPGGRRGGPGR